MFVRFWTKKTATSLPQDFEAGAWWAVPWWIDDCSIFQIGILPNEHGTSSSTTHSLEVCKSLSDLYNLLIISEAALWAETDYGLAAGQHAVLCKGKGLVGKYWQHINILVMRCWAKSLFIIFTCCSLYIAVNVCCWLYCMCNN